MAITKEMIVDRIEVLENGTVQIRTATKIKEDGKQISETFHRHVVAPGDNYSAETDRVKAVCAAIHTANVVDAYVEYKAALAEPK
jgi:hypothetical protein